MYIRLLKLLLVNMDIIDIIIIIITVFIIIVIVVIGWGRALLSEQDNKQNRLHRFAF